MPISEEEKRRRKRERELAETETPEETARRLGLAVPTERRRGLSEADRLELAQARARRAGIEEPTEIRRGEFIYPTEEAGRIAREKGVEQLERQEEILERERLRREGEPEITELPPEELPPITEPALVEPEVTGFAAQIKAAEELLEEGPLGEKDMLGRVGLVLSVLPGGGANVAGKAALNTAKIATGVRATKAWTGMLKLLKTNWKKLAKWTTIGYALWSERSIGNIDSALSQVRESITLPVSLAASNPNRITDAFDMLTDLELDVREYESDVKLKEIYSPTFKLTGRTRPIYQRIKKLDAALDLARTQIARTAALGVIPTDEEVILMTNEINEILNQMEQPSKFLGII